MSLAAQVWQHWKESWLLNNGAQLWATLGARHAYIAASDVPDHVAVHGAQR